MFRVDLSAHNTLTSNQDMKTWAYFLTKLFHMVSLIPRKRLAGLKCPVSSGANIPLGLTCLCEGSVRSPQHEHSAVTQTVYVNPPHLDALRLFVTDVYPSQNPLDSDVRQ